MKLISPLIYIYIYIDKTQFKLLSFGFRFYNNKYNKTNSRNKQSKIDLVENNHDY